jgi:RNA polymerase sigma factor (sigma-70 family)
MSGASREFTALYRAARARDPGADEELLRRFQTALGYYIRHRLGMRAREAWEDIRQDTLITVLDRLESYPEEMHENEFQAFLFQTAKRKVSNYLRSSPIALDRVCPLSARFDAPADAMGPATTAGVRDECRRIRERISELRSIHAGVLRCVLLECRTLSETASLLGLTEEAARKRLQRASAELLRLLGADAREVPANP